MKLNPIDPVNWHRAAIQALKSENENKRGVCGTLLIKKPLQLSLNCVAAATGVASAAREIFVLMGKSCLGVVKLATLPVRLFPRARPHHDKLPGFTSCAQTAKRVCGQTCGIFASVLGGAFFFLKGPELNVRAQKSLGNMRQIYLAKKTDAPKADVPKVVSAAVNAAAAARQAVAHLASKLEDSAIVQESQKWASRQVVAFLSIISGNGGKPIVAAIPTGPALHGQAMVASIPMGEHGAATLTIVPLEGFQVIKPHPQYVSPNPSPRKLTSPAPLADIIPPHGKPQQVIQQQQGCKKPADVVAQKPKATPKKAPDLMGGGAAQIADQVAAAARNRNLKPANKPGTVPPPPPPPPSGI